MAAAVPTKVFVGNLSFKTRDADLARAFEVVGKVTSANIITRGPRSLGYGFVELASEEEANKSIGQLNKSDLDGRQINVEIARPREQTGQDGASTDANASAGRPRPRRRRPQAVGGAVSAAPASGDAAGSGVPVAARPRRIRKPRTDAPAGGASGAAGNSAGASGSASGNSGGASGGASGGEDGRRPARRGRGRRFGRFQRFRRQRTDDQQQQQPRIPSTTTLFVANLHYEVDNEGLAEIFKEYNPVKAYVVQTNSGRSRGFGFVEFANETDQQNALNGIDKKVVSDRPLSVKVSQVRPPQQAGSGAGSGSGSGAGAGSGESSKN